MSAFGGANYRLTDYGLTDYRLTDLLCVCLRRCGLQINKLQITNYRLQITDCGSLRGCLGRCPFVLAQENDLAEVVKRKSELRISAKFFLKFLIIPFFLTKKDHLEEAAKRKSQGWG